MVILKTKSEIEGIRKASIIVAEVLDIVVPEHLRPGISTGELNHVIERYIRSKGGYPTFLGYHGYPAASCISLNDEVVHGIPNKRRVIKEGDLVKVDVGVTLNGLIGDAARTYAVGEVSEQTKRLMETTFKALYAGIEAARIGNRIRDISTAIYSVIKSHGFYAVRELSGHGVGLRLHEDPSIPNFPQGGRSVRIRPGMTLAIEPMVAVGTWEVLTKSDGWTVVTKDHSLAAHFEHTIAITDDGPEILTVLEGMDLEFDRFFLPV